MKKENRKPVTTAVILVVSILFFAAMMTVLSPCGPKEDGTFMSCHYAGLALRILSGAAIVVSIAAFFQRNFSRIADSILIVLGIAAILIPGTVIHLCMMPGMQCRAVMRPGSIVFAALLIAASVADLVAGRRSA